jgi:hypothetical protein
LAAIDASLEENTDNHRPLASTSTKSGDAHEILQRFISDNFETAGHLVNVVVLRKSILKSTLFAIGRKSFSLCNPLAITCSGEDAVDVGGPKREFFRLLMISLKETGMT